MEVNVFLREMYRIGKRWDEICVFEQTHSLNNTEMQTMREVVAAEETGGRIISSQLAKKLGVTRSAVSQMVHKLETRNYVRRVSDERDKKIAYIELSDFARGIYEQMKKRFSQFLEKVTAKLSEERLEEFIGRANEFLDACEWAAASFCGNGSEKNG